MANLNTIARIQFIGDLKGYLDLDEDTILPLTFSVAEIRDISKKKGTFSKSITIPATKNNNRLLNNYFDINIIAGTFDVNKLQYCNVIQNGICILENAIIQLVSINKEQENSYYEDKITYTLLIKDGSADFFSKLDNKYLKDIDLSFLNHTKSASTVINSFSNTILDGYKYLMPFNPEIVDDASFNLDEFQPAVYTKIYFDKIFANAGFSYQWDSLSNEDINFDKLLIPFNGDASTKISLKKIQLDLQNESEDVSTATNYWFETSTDVSANTFTIINKPFNYNGNRQYSFYVEINNVKNPLTGNLLIGNRFILNIINIATNDIEFTFNMSVNQNGDMIFAKAFKQTPVLTSKTYRFELQSLSNNFTYDSLNIYVRYLILPNFLSKSGTFNNTANPLGYYNDIFMNDYIPDKIKQSDFIKSIFTMYNIFVEVDKNNKNNLILKTRDDYYDTGKIVDWTDKLIKDQTQDIKFLPELQSKKILLTYKEDEDVVNKAYKEGVNQVYGQLEYEFQNDFIKGLSKQEIIFSPTPITNVSFEAVLPCIIGSAPKNNIRILVDGGVFPCLTYKIYSTPTITLTGNTYPSISHFNHPTNPTFDLNFGVCEYYLRTDEYSKTSNNLFNLHWRRTFNQINNGKMLTAYFNLNEIDIQKLKLNDKIRINNSWWNINKIQDYNANDNNPTKIELLSIDDELYIDFISSEPVKLSKSSSIINSVNSNLTNELILTKNINFSNLTDINGFNNIIYDGVRRGSVNGYFNVLYSDSYVYGDYNIIETGLTNSFIIGNNITADTSNTLYTNNIQLTSGSTINNVPVSAITSQLELLDEGNGFGWRIYGRDPNNYLNIGLEAIDLSASFSSGNYGATGSYSFAAGTSNLASGNTSTAFGRDNIVSGDYSFVIGRDNVVTGDYSFASGRFNEANGLNSVSLGSSNLVNGDNSFSTGNQNIVLGNNSAVIGGQSITGLTDDTVYVPNLNINYTPSASTGTTASELLLREADGTIKTITITDLINLISISGMSEQELILDISVFYNSTGHTVSIIKDDLNYGTGLVVDFNNIGSGAGYAIWVVELGFSSAITNKLFLKHINLPNNFYREFDVPTSGGYDNYHNFFTPLVNVSSTVKLIKSNIESGTFTTGQQLDFQIVFKAIP